MMDVDGKDSHVSSNSSSNNKTNISNENNLDQSQKQQQQQQQQLLYSSAALIKSKNKQTYTFDQVSYDHFKSFVETEYEANKSLFTQMIDVPPDADSLKAQLKAQIDVKKQAILDKQKKLQSAEDNFFGLYFKKNILLSLFYLLFVCLDIFVRQAIDKIDNEILVLEIDQQEKKKLITLKVDEILQIIKNIRMHILIRQYLGDSFHETFFEHACTTKYIQEEESTDDSDIPIVGGAIFPGKKNFISVFIYST